MKRHFFQKLLMIVSISLLMLAPALMTAAAAPTAGLTGAPLLESAAKRIQFAPGATSQVVSGNLAASSRIRYIMRLKANQLLDVTMTASGRADISVTTTDGRALSAVTKSSSGFRGYIPSSGDFVLEVRTGRKPISYSLNVSVPRRISFEKGATAFTFNAQAAVHQSLDYILGAQAGQLMEISVTPENKTQLVIFGVDGSVLRSGMGGGSTFRGRLPLSEDYIVSVRAGDQAVSFTMSVIIPQRIRFEPGAYSASLPVTLHKDQTQYYVLRALKNQTLRVSVRPSLATQLIIYGADGTVLKSGMGGGSSFAGKLPSTQDYIIAIRAGQSPVAYIVRISIQ
jgi:hypothetical protein